MFVTGRPPRWMHDVASRTSVRGLAICSNGALVYDLGERRVLLSRLLPPEVSQPLLPRLRDTFPGIAFAVETEDGFAREPSYQARYDVGQEERVAPAEELLTEPVAKLLARHEDMTYDDLLDAARDMSATPGPCPTPRASGRRLLEIRAWRSKATTWNCCANGAGSPRGRTGFGDMPNDLPLLPGPAAAGRWPTPP